MHRSDARLGSILGARALVRQPVTIIAQVFVLHASSPSDGTMKAGEGGLCNKADQFNAIQVGLSR